MLKGSTRINFSPYDGDSIAAKLVRKAEFSGSEGDGMYSATLREFAEFCQDNDVDADNFCVFTMGGQEIPEINTVLTQVDLYDD